MPHSRRHRSGGPTPLADIANWSGLTLTTRTWMERTVADVAFDSFSFGHDVLCTDPMDSGARGALERGFHSDGTVLAVGSMPWTSVNVPWIAVQSKRGPNNLDLDQLADASSDNNGSYLVGHDRFDATFDLDADDDSMDLVRSVLSDELCAWAVAADERDGPLTVIFDGPEADSIDAVGHGTTVFVAREVGSDDAFVETMSIAVDLVTELLRAVED